MVKMDNKIVKFPNKHERLKRIDINSGKLRCEVSERWISFPGASWKTNNLDYLALDIMTLGANDKERKLCEIIVDREQLQKMLKELPINDQTET